MSSEGKAAKLVKDSVKQGSEDVVEKSDSVKNKVSNNISNITDKKQKESDSGNSLLTEAADKASILAHQAYDKASSVGQRAAEAVSNSSDYIKNLDIEGAKDSVKTVIKEKPEYTLLAVGILGLAVGYLLGKKSV